MAAADFEDFFGVASEADKSSLKDFYVGSPVFDYAQAKLRGPSQESTESYADLELRWARIEVCLQWGPYASGPAPDPFGKPITCKWPQTQYKISELRHNIESYYKRWLPFRDRWRAYDFDLPQLSSQVTNLTQAEREMISAGADIKDAPKPAPDIATASPALKAADKTDEVVKKAAETAKEAGKDAAQFIKDTGGLGVAPFLSDLWENIPTWAKVAGAGGIALYGVTQIATISRVFR